MGSVANSWFETRSRCPACTADTLQPLYSAPFSADPVRQYLTDFYAADGGEVEFEYLDGATYALCECARCGLIFQEHVPGDELMERLYEHWIDPRGTYERHLRDDDLSYYAGYASDIMQIVSLLGTAPASISVLDFGMGWGKWASMAKAFGCDAHGTELSDDRIAHARSSGIKIVSWDEIPGRRFDFINADQVFEHIPEPLETLRHLKTGLGEEGIIKISVPRPDDIDRKLKVMDWSAPKSSRDSLNDVAPLEHINCFRQSSLHEMAAEAGMEQLYVPVALQYKTMTDWSGLKKSAKQLLRPVYRSWLKKGNVVFLRHRRGDRQTMDGGSAQ